MNQLTTPQKSLILLKRWHSSLALLILLWGSSANLWADSIPTLAEILEQQGPFHVRLIFKEDSSTQATISWSTAKSTEQNQVLLKKQGEQDHQKLTTTRDGKFSGDLDLYYHHVRLTGLSPDTVYQVQFISDDQKSAWYQFQTVTQQDQPLTFLFGGDSRSDRSARREMNRKMAQLLEESLQDESAGNDILCLWHGGDYIGSGNRLDHWTYWLTDHEQTITKDNRLLPIVPTRGNHDRGAIFNELFDFSEEDKNYYGTQFGPEVRLVTLNTETSMAGDQAKWLEKELKASRSENRYLVVQYHRPAWPAVKGPSGALTNWVPLFEKYNIDLACEADGHNIKRTVPIRDGKQDPTGIVYIGEGGLGVPQRTPKVDRWFLQSPGMADRGHHVQRISFTKEELTVQVIMLDGSVRDQFTQSVRSDR